jgi:hypothetical protein
MSRKSGPAHVVVDGSNIATEGRSLPSLAQLSEAVAGFMDEHPQTAVTVVVDATFGHRIDKKEVKEFEEGISNNELVAPPAGAVGRGDAFVLGIADKAKATVISNDSFQEFHGEYEWLFDEGRLIGGKPVPHVGWVWVDRIPVRGPVSRKATRGSGTSTKTRSTSAGRSGSGSGSKSGGRRSSKAASEPMPVPTAPPPGAKAQAGESAEPSARAQRSAPKAQEAVNELLPFLEFVEHHPVGTSVNGTVDAYSSHGAYITIGDAGVRGYVPLRLMSNPPPRSARKVMKLGESVTVVVASFAPARRSIDCALPDMAKSLPSDEVVEGVGLPGGKAVATRKTAAKKTAAKKTVAKKTVAKKSAAKKTVAKKSAAKKSVAKKTVARKTAAKKTAPTKSAAKRSTAKKTAATKSAPAGKAATAQSTESSTPKKSAARKTASAKSSKPKAPAKSVAKKPASTKPTAARPAAKKRTAARAKPSAPPATTAPEA